MLCFDLIYWLKYMMCFLHFQLLHSSKQVIILVSEIRRIC